jgi:uncharacterized membrane protein HdeD (DUF308 family)
MVDEAITVDEVEASTRSWWLIALVGALSTIAGVVVLIKPGNSLSTLAVILGVFLLLDGIIELIAALFAGNRNRGTLAVSGAITAIIGMLLIRHPVEGVTFVALLIGIWLVTIGLIRIIAAFEVAAHRGWALTVGAIELIAGAVIVADPNIGFATLAVLVGIAFIANGLGTLALGWAMHAVHSEASRATGA